MLYKQMFEIHTAIEKFANPPYESMHTVITQCQIISDRAAYTKNKRCCRSKVFIFIFVLFFSGTNQTHCSDLQDE